jgi:hypothetical protein
VLDDFGGNVVALGSLQSEGIGLVGDDSGNFEIGMDAGIDQGLQIGTVTRDQDNDSAVC